MERPTSKPIGHHYLELDTPTMVINTDLLKSNIKNAQSSLNGTSCKLIPNVGTHGTAEIARYQTNSDHDLPVFVDTFQQAQSFVNHGFKNIIIESPPVGVGKVESLHRLVNTAHITVSLSSLAHLNFLKHLSMENLSVLLRIPNKSDSVGIGTHQELIELVKLLVEHFKIYWKGLITVSKGSDSLKESFKGILSAEALLQSHSFTSNELLINTSNQPLSKAQSNLPPEITGLISGNYPFEVNGSVSTCSVVSTVMSTPEPGRAYIDCGQKAISIDRGVPFVVNYENAVIEKMSAEHGYLVFDAVEMNLKIGDKILLRPANYSDTFNLYDFVNLIKNDRLESVIETAARGAFK
jgi:D-serine deaminase-like pyridoxal phosphate-dependent protein